MATHACNGRKGATKGSDVWCRCNGREQPIRSKSVCETDGGGRKAVCQWSAENASCMQKGGASSASSQTDHMSWPRHGSGSKLPTVECPSPRGNTTEWSDKFAAKGHRLTVATWNVEWLFDGVDDPAPVPKRGDAAQVSARVHDIAEVLHRIDADLINFAEVENCDMLSRVAIELGSSHEPYLVAGTDSALRQQVGLLSRMRPLQQLWRSSARSEFPLPASKCGLNKPGTGKPASTGVSKHLVARFSPVQGQEIVVIGLHLKAFPDRPDACAQREGQAHVIRGIVKEELERGRHVIVLGDLNDFDPDVPDAGGQVPTSSVLRMIKDIDDDGKPELWNALEMVPDRERYTNWFDRNRDRTFQWETERSLLDHMLLSQSLRPLVEAVGIDHAHDPSRISDHWPVWVRLNLSPWIKQDSHSAPERSANSESPLAVVSAAGPSPVMMFAAIPLLVAVLQCWRMRRRFAAKGEKNKA